LPASYRFPLWLKFLLRTLILYANLPAARLLVNLNFGMLFRK
jgi:hypothetical protein